MTHTKTFVLLHPWAESTPWPADIPRDVNGAHAARPGDPCEAPQCDATLEANEVCYHVTELSRDGREPWVCWRHVLFADPRARIGHVTDEEHTFYPALADPADPRGYVARHRAEPDD
jgi:hypothetical protein